MNIHHLLILHCLVHQPQCTVPEIEAHLRSKQHPLHYTGVYRALNQLEAQDHIVSKFMNRLPITKGYSITSHGMQAYRKYLQVLDLSNPALDSPAEAPDSLPQFTWDDPDFQLELQDIISDTLFDDPLTPHQKRGLQKCIGQIVKSVQRWSSVFIIKED